MDREREERNYFQLERDKIHTFWEITRRQLEEKKAELRNKDREMEEAEERHQVEIKVSGKRLPVPLQSLRRCWSVCAGVCMCSNVCVQQCVGPVNRWSSSCPQVYKQKVKHLLYEHQNNLTEMKAEGTVAMKLAQKEHQAQEGTLRRDTRALKVELKEQELANEVAVKNLRLVGHQLAARTASSSLVNSNWEFTFFLKN